MKIKSGEWKKHFANINAELGHQPIHIDGDSLRCGGQFDSGWHELDKISYNSEYDSCDLSVSGRALQFKRLQEIHLVFSNSDIAAIEITGTDAVKHCIRFREPLPMQEPAAAMEAV